MRKPILPRSTCTIFCSRSCESCAAYLRKAGNDLTLPLSLCMAALPLVATSSWFTAHPSLDWSVAPLQAGVVSGTFSPSYSANTTSVLALVTNATCITADFNTRQVGSSGEGTFRVLLVDTDGLISGPDLLSAYGGCELQPSARDRYPRCRFVTMPLERKRPYYLGVVAVPNDGAANAYFAGYYSIAYRALPAGIATLPNI